MPANNLGVLAFGDSITNGGGELQWGVALQSWALWVARGLGLPFTGCAVDGATVIDVVDEQLPRFERTGAYPDGRYDLGCIYIGSNDVRGADWDPQRFERGFAAAVQALCARSERTLAVTAPLDLGRPRAGAKVGELNAIIERVARSHHALVLDLSGFKGRNLVMADHVHPTALGQIAIAEWALEVLSGDGLAARVQPRTLIRYETTWLERLRGDVGYAYRHLKVSARAAALTTAFALRPR